MSLVREIEYLIDEENWGDYFTFDQKAAEAEGVVELCWKNTGRPVPLGIRISNVDFEKKLINWRDLRRRIKLSLPKNILKERASEANDLLRNASRRNLKEVEKDFLNWQKKTFECLESIFGLEAAKKFLEEVPLPSKIKAGSIQHITLRVETKIDVLKNY